MKVNLIDSINLDCSINCVKLYNEHNIIFLTTTGEIKSYNFDTQETNSLFNTNSGALKFRDGGFDPTAVSSIYTLDEVIVVVNNYKCHGYIFNSKENYKIHFSRVPYHEDISKYPIVLFKNDLDVLFLAFATEWNRLQIVNLNTRQIITADKSLIEENAEQQHIDFYKTHVEKNKLLWPRGYDYFYGGLKLSPDHKTFASAGWVWGSSDCIKVYNIEDFMNNHRIKDTTIGFYEHNNRDVCFVDNTTIATIYNAYFEGESSEEKTPWEILLYNVNDVSDKKKITLENSYNLGNANLDYDPKTQNFYLYNDSLGLIVYNAVGKLIFHNINLKIQECNLKLNRLICLDDNSIFIYKITD
ncbi:hypothetical protein [Fusobacterium sp. PH5-44]|uniref:hypothetical protein n=1 Tax=unclassified Fusobacterium TaxID=2648384 RepID=UPI003D1BB363